MKHFIKNDTCRIQGHLEVIPIDEDNIHEYIEELVSLPYLNDDTKKLILFLDKRIEALESELYNTNYTY